MGLVTALAIILCRLECDFYEAVGWLESEELPFNDPVKLHRQDKS